MPETDTTQEKASEGLWEKLLAAQKSAQKVEKRGENKAQGYTYAQASDVIEEAHRALHEAGLVAYITPGERSAREITSQGGSAGLFVTLEASLVIADPATRDESIVIGAVGTGVDYPGDKAIYKALTGAAKYAYASALGIPFGDDPEGETGGSGQERAPASDAPATGPQKGSITRILNRAGVSEALRFELVEAVGGKPLTKAGASAILDRIAPVQDDPAALTAAVEALMVEANVTPPSDIPADTEGLPEVEVDQSTEPLTLEQRAEPVDPVRDD